MSKFLSVTTRHVLIVVGMSLGMAFTTPGLIYAQSFGGNVDSGRTLARA
jgi:hypothetical protein